MRNATHAIIILLIIPIFIIPVMANPPGKTDGGSVIAKIGTTTGPDVEQLVNDIKSGGFIAYGGVPKDALYTALNQHPEFLTESALQKGMTSIPSDWNPSKSILVMKVLSDGATDPNLLNANPTLRKQLLSLFGMTESGTAAGTESGLSIKKYNDQDFILRTKDNSIILGKPMPKGTTILPDGRIQIPGAGIIKNGLIQQLSGEAYGSKKDITKISLDKLSTPPGEYWVPPSITFDKSNPPKNLVLDKLEGLPKIELALNGASDVFTASTLPFEFEYAGQKINLNVGGRIIFDSDGLMKSFGYLEIKENGILFGSRQDAIFPNFFTQGQSCQNALNCFEKKTDGTIKFSKITENKVWIFTFADRNSLKSFQFTKDSISDSSSEVMIQSNSIRTDGRSEPIGGVTVTSNGWKIDGDPTVLKKDLNIMFESTGTSNVLADGDVKSCAVSGCATRLHVSEYNTESYLRNLNQLKQVVGEKRAGELRYIIVASESTVGADKILSDSAQSAYNDLKKHGVDESQITYIRTPNANNVYATVEKISKENPNTPTVFASWMHGDLGTGTGELVTTSGQRSLLDPGKLASSFKGPGVIVQTSCGAGAGIAVASSCASYPLAYMAAAPQGREDVIIGTAYQSNYQSFGNYILPPHKGSSALAYEQFARNFLEAQRNAATQVSSKKREASALPLLKVIIPNTKIQSGSE